MLSLKAIVSLCLIGLLLQRFSFPRTVSLLSKSDWRYSVAGFLMIPILYFILAARFRTVLRKGGFRMRIKDTLRLVYIGQFWNFFLPGSTGGDVYRVAEIWGSHPERKTHAVFAVLADRVLATFALFLMATVGVLLIPNYEKAMRQWCIISSPFSIGLLTGLSSITVVLLIVVLSFRKRLSGLYEIGKGKWSEAKTFYRVDSDLISAFILAIAGHSINCIAFFCFSNAVGFSLSIVTAFLIVPVLQILLMIPLSLNGHGIREVGIITLFGLLQVGWTKQSSSGFTEGVIALSAVALACEFVWGLPGAIFFALGRKPSAAAIQAVVT